MAERKPAKKGTQKAAKSTTVTGKRLDGFTGEERAAMRERVQELKAGTHAGKTDGESALLAKIAAMAAPDRAMGERLHAIIKASAPFLSPKTWYGMPAYAKDGQVVCFFQSAQKFNTRYATPTGGPSARSNARCPLASAAYRLDMAVAGRCLSRRRVGIPPLN